MPSVPYHTKPKAYPGSSEQEILNEPDWEKTHSHRIGFRDRENRYPGFTHHGDEWKREIEFEERAEQREEELLTRVRTGDLVTVRDVMQMQEDYHIRRPEVYPKGWRYVLHTTEKFIKEEQNWPANVKRKEQEKKQKVEEMRKEQDLQEEHEWRRDRGENATHQDAYATQEDEGEMAESGGGQDGEWKEPRTKYSAQELAFLKCLQHEQEYMIGLENHDGRGRSPVLAKQLPTSIDETDQFTPDHWVPRGKELIRNTGKHPFNAEPELSALFQAGLITPNRLHYVRNHGAVPHLRWETHRLEIGQSVLSMDDLKYQFRSINIPIALACDGNRRKELNMIRRSKGFDWGAAAVSCAYWKGALLRDVLLAAGVSDPSQMPARPRRWVNFEGADELSEGKYATCIPLEYAIDPANDVLLAYEMNDSPLPPDHGFPLRLMIPGFVGGRCIKWLAKIWISDRENDSYFHINDNRVLPSFVVDMDSEFAITMFNHPSTICNEQNLNSVIVKPSHGERISLAEVGKGKTYRVEGFAYDGGGHEVQRVEVSLDNGQNWLYCIRRFPDSPVRHGNKFWTWLHWYVDIEISHLVRAENITVRCFSVFKNTQPERPSWNITGMMNNCWYVVRPRIEEDSQNGDSFLSFLHPCEQGSGEGGWMKPSTENRQDDVRHEAAASQKQFTRKEIEKHSSEKDCWIVVNGKVYDATSVLDWHPGGKAAIMAHAGKVHAETTEEFDGIHDDYAQQKLSECVLGIATKHAMTFIRRHAEKAAREKARSSQDNREITLDRHRWTPVRFLKKEILSEDTNSYTFELPAPAKSLGLATCQHIQLGFHFLDKLIYRPYTPTRPVLEKEEDGTFDLVVKTYLPDHDQPGGTVSNILDCLREGEEVEVKGPTGEIRYLGRGCFAIDDKQYTFDKITLIVGGSGITPAYQLIARILRSERHSGPKINVIDANKTENDILLRSELDGFAQTHKEQFHLTHVLATPSEDWKGKRGFVNKDILEKYSFEPGKRNVALLCGPPAFIQKAVLPASTEMGYKEDKNLFGF